MLMVLLRLHLQTSSWWMMVVGQDNTCCFFYQSKSISTLLGPKSYQHILPFNCWTVHNNSEFHSSIATFPGNKSHLTTLKKGDQSVQRTEKQLLVIYDEDSIMDRPGLGIPACVHLVIAHLLLLTWQAWQEAWPCCEAKRGDLSLDASPGSPGDEESQVGFHLRKTSQTQNTCFIMFLIVGSNPAEFKPGITTPEATVVIQFMVSRCLPMMLLMFGSSSSVRKGPSLPSTVLRWEVRPQKVLMLRMEAWLCFFEVGHQLTHLVPLGSDKKSWLIGNYEKM